MAGEISRKNGKKGGRKPGVKNKSTLEREAVLKELKQRVLGVAHGLLDSQLVLARGTSYLYKIEKYWEKVTDKKGKPTKVLRRKPPKLVEDEWEIRQYLEGLTEEGDLEDPEDTYYFMTTKSPDNKAIDSMMNRTFGKAVQALALTDPEGEDLYDAETKKKSKDAVAQILGRGKDSRKG